MEAFLALLSVPLAILNLAAGVVSAIWLVLLGEWKLVLFGFGYAMAGTFLIGVALLPGMLFAGPAGIAAERGHNLLAFFIGLPSLVWTYLLLFGSCFWFMAHAARIHDGPMMPYALWAYATALGPWSYMARKESETGNEYSVYSVAGAQISTALMGAALIIDPTDYSFDRLVWWMLPGIVAAVFLQAAHVRMVTRRYRIF